MPYYINETTNLLYWSDVNITFNTTITEPVTSSFFNNIPYAVIFNMILLPAIITLLLFLAIKFKPEIMKFIQKKRADYGYVIIWMLGNNKRIKEKMVKLNEFNNFTFKDGRYSLEKMQHFVIGYRNNIPVFFYDKNFILPLVIEKKKVDDKIKAQYKTIGVTLKDDEIQAIGIKLEPAILDLVYRKKLISDLYSAVKDDGMNKIFMWALIIGGALLILYYTGILEQILTPLGVHIGSGVNGTK